MNIFNDVFKESIGTSVGFRFKNFISLTGVGEEQRICQWDQPLLTFDLSKEVVEQTEINDLMTFYEEQEGKTNTFLYLDPFDNFADNETLNFLNTEEFGIIIPSGENRYKLFKHYRLTDLDNIVSASNRQINYPFNLSLYVNDSVFLDWSWDSVTKEIVTTLTPNTYRAKFNFYVPVRFNDDTFEYSLIGYEDNNGIYTIPKLTLVEIREIYELHTNNFYKNSLNHFFAIDAFADSSSIFQYQSDIEETDSGFEKRANNSLKSFNITLGDRLLSNDEVVYLICLYRLTRGNSASFKFNDLATAQAKIVRFDSDFSLKVEGEEECGILATFNSLSLLEVVDIDKNVLISGYNISSQEKRKFPLYYGFTSANGAEYAESRIKSAYLNNQQFIGGGNVPKTVNGYASLSSINSEVVLVPNTKKTVGSCFVDEPLNNSFDIKNFSIYFIADVGKDGLAFILHGQSTGKNAIGVMTSELGNSINFLTTAQILDLDEIEGKSLGYVGISPSIAIELDCYKNEFDPNDNHIGVNVNGSLSSFAYGTPSFSLQDASNVHVWIDYSNTILRIYANTSATKPSELFSTVINIPDYLGIYQESVFTTGASVDKTIYSQALCYCWKLTKTNGEVIGATNHDRNLIIDNILYQANGGFSGSSIDTDYEMSVDNSEVKSFFTNTAINEQDILGGRYDEAEVITYLVDWNTMAIVSVLQKGIVGQITNTDRNYTLEVRSILELLQQKNAKKTSSNCPLVFGESGPNKCNKNLAGLSVETTITNVTNNKTFTISSSHASGYFDYGSIEFLSGSNTGYVWDIYSYDGSTLVLWQNLPYNVSIGDSVRITKGCEKSLTACQGYGNVANFGGDPFVPGADTYLSGALEYSNPID